MLLKVILAIATSYLVEHTQMHMRRTGNFQQKIEFILTFTNCLTTSVSDRQYVICVYVIYIKLNW